MRKSIATISSVGRRSGASSLAETQIVNNMDDTFSPMPLNSGPESVIDMSGSRPDSKKHTSNEYERYVKNAGT